MPYEGKLPKSAFYRAWVTSLDPFFQLLHDTWQNTKSLYAISFSSNIDSACSILLHTGVTPPWVTLAYHHLHQWPCPSLILGHSPSHLGCCHALRSSQQVRSWVYSGKTHFTHDLLRALLRTLSILTELHLPKTRTWKVKWGIVCELKPHPLPLEPNHWSSELWLLRTWTSI